MDKNKKKYDVVFSILSLIEVNFLIPIAEKLIQDGRSVCFILFHDAAKKLLIEKNIEFFSVFELMEIQPYREVDLEKLRDLQEEYGIKNMRDLYMREKLGYDRTDEKILLKKSIHYIQIINKIFIENEINMVLQTTGAFAANQSIYYSAKKNKIHHVFFEHSPFNEKALFLSNTYLCNIPDKIINATVSAENARKVKQYIEEYNRQKFLRSAIDNKHCIVT